MVWQNLDHNQFCLHDRHLAHMLCDCCDLLHANIFFSAQLLISQLRREGAIEKYPRLLQYNVQKSN